MIDMGWNSGIDLVEYYILRCGRVWSLDRGISCSGKTQRDGDALANQSTSPWSWTHLIFFSHSYFCRKHNPNTTMAKRTKEEKSNKEKSAVPLVKSKAEIDPALASLFAQSVGSNSYCS